MEYQQRVGTHVASKAGCKLVVYDCGGSTPSRRTKHDNKGKTMGPIQWIFRKLASQYLVAQFRAEMANAGVRERGYQGSIQRLEAMNDRQRIRVSRLEQELARVHSVIEDAGLGQAEYR